MCLAIPAQIHSLPDAAEPLAVVDILGVRRRVNIELLSNDPPALGDWVLIHVGFAMSKVDEKEAEATLRLLRELDAYNTEFDQFKSSIQ